MFFMVFCDSNCPWIIKIPEIPSEDKEEVERCIALLLCLALLFLLDEECIPPGIQ
jgi:hypothetical protein